MADVTNLFLKSKPPTPEMVRVMERARHCTEELQELRSQVRCLTFEDRVTGIANKLEEQLRRKELELEQVTEELKRFGQPIVVSRSV